MSQKKSLRDFRSTLVQDDRHGVNELLRQVAERSSLDDDSRAEVNQIVNRLEQHQANKTPMGKFKKKFADSLDKVADGVEKMEERVAKPSSNDPNASISDHSEYSDEEVDDIEEEANTGSHKSGGGESVKKFGKDLVKKFSDMSTAMPKKPLIPPVNLKPPSMNINMNTNMNTQATSEAIKARKLKMKEALERSSKSGRDIFQNFSKKCENSLRNLENSLVKGGSATVPEAVEADYDVNSPEYKMDIKGIALLKEIFPNESTENLIKMHFEHIQANKDLS